MRWTFLLVLFLAGCQGLGRDGGAVAEGPGTAESVDGLPIAYTVVGRGDPTLVFIHGWCCDQGYWSKQVPEFQKRYRTVTLDLPGHGASGREREEWTLDAFGRDVAQVVWSLDLQPVILVGHSMGGPVALAAARLMPERTLGVIAVDTLHDADFEPDPSQYEFVRQAFASDFNAGVDMFTEFMRTQGAEARLVEEVGRSMRASSTDMALGMMNAMSAYEMAPAMEATPCPIRAINAPQNPTSIENNRKYADYDAVVMEGVSHFLMMEKPGEFNRHLEAFVEELAGR